MKIRRELIQALIEIAKENHPHEFFALLTGRKGIIEEFVYIPFQQGEDYASFNTSLIPIGMRIYGTIHSHPSSVSRPSPQDLATFSSYGKVHIIIHYPYCESCWKAYDSAGNEVDVEVI